MMTNYDVDYKMMTSYFVIDDNKMMTMMTNHEDQKDGAWTDSHQRLQHKSGQKRNPFEQKCQEEIRIRILKVDPMKSEHNSNQEGDYQADQNLHHHLNRQNLSQTPSYRNLHFDVDLVLKLILLRAPILRLLASVNNLLQFDTYQKLCNS